MYAWEFAKFLCAAEAHGYARFVAMQNHYNLVYREEEREMIPLCRAEGIGIIPWSPLARGFLAGNRSRQTPGETTRAQSDQFAQRLYYQESDFAIVDRVTQLAHKRGVSNAQIALTWMLHRDGIIAPIIGATKPHHLDESIKALQVKLDREEIEALEEPYQPHPILGID